MKSLKNLIWLLLLVVACAPPESGDTVSWLGKPVRTDLLREVANTYHVFDSTNQKVGSMIFNLSRDGSRWVFQDTSQLDNGSLYETIRMDFNLESAAMEQADMDIHVQGAQAFIDLQPTPNSLLGTYKVTQDTIDLVDNQIDSAYAYDVFREEVYMLINATEWAEGDSIGFKMFFPNNLTVLDAALTYEGSETVSVGAGEFETDVVYLNTGGFLDNRIWISKEKYPRLVKFYVPNAEFKIELMESRERRE